MDDRLNIGNALNYLIPICWVELIHITEPQLERAAARLYLVEASVAAAQSFTQIQYSLAPPPKHTDPVLLTE